MYNQGKHNLNDIYKHVKFFKYSKVKSSQTKSN